MIKNTNLKQIYNLVHQEQGISRAELAKRTKLSKTTVSALVDELLERDFLMGHRNFRQQNCGKKAQFSSAEAGTALCGSTLLEEEQVLGYLTDICGSVRRHLPDCRKKRPISYVERSRALFDLELLPAISPEKAPGICIVVPAMIDPDTREIFSTSFHLPGPDGIRYRGGTGSPRFGNIPWRF